MLRDLILKEIEVQMKTEVLIIGGSFAGLAAAMQLVRGHREVVVLDAGRPRNRFAAHAHGIFGMDGKSPEDIKNIVLDQLKYYPSFQYRKGEAVRGTYDELQQRFIIGTSEFEIIAKKVILATGVKDQLPQIKGLTERWGKTVVHCPYCHGYELSHRQLGVIATHPLSIHQAAMIPDWGVTTLFTQGILELDLEQRKLLEQRQVVIESSPVLTVNGQGSDIESVTLANGTEVAIKGIYVAPSIDISNPMLEAFKCELEEGPLGNVIKVNEFKETSFPGLFAAGDVSNIMQNGTLAIASGTIAGVGAQKSLMFGE